MQQGINHTTSKISNRNQILKLVLINESVSRLELHQLTGLSKMTISNIVGEFLEEGIMQECTDENDIPSAGRKTKLVSIVPSSLLAIGINIEQSFVQVGIVNLEGSILLGNSIPLSNNETPESFLRKIDGLIQSVLLDEYKECVWGIGISAVGPNDIRNGRLIGFHNTCLFPEMDIITPLREKYDLPVFLENDVNVSALAELYFGYGKQLNDFLYVSIKEGIGSGIVIDRKLYSGQYGHAGEIGHMLVEYNGKECVCGNRGCLEQYASISAILRWYGEESGQNIPINEHSWISLVDGVYRNDELCVKSLDRMCEYLASAFTSAANVLDFQQIFIGGYVTSAENYLLPYLNYNVGKKRFAPIGEVKIATSKFPNNSSFVGTAALVIEGNCPQIANG